MKRIFLFLLVSILSFTTLLNVNGQKKAIVKEYDQIKIGSQIWMTKNLSITHFQNGDEIPEINDSIQWIKAGKERRPARCSFKFDPRNVERYGYLYNWYVLSDSRGFVPSGWRIPTKDDFMELINLFGGLSNISTGNKLKDTLYWERVSVERYPGSPKGNNFSGFSALPAGVCSDMGNRFWVQPNIVAQFWSSTKWVWPNWDRSAWVLLLSSEIPVQEGPRITQNNVYIDLRYYENGLSVRCIR